MPRAESALQHGQLSGQLSRSANSSDGDSPNAKPVLDELEAVLRDLRTLLAAPAASCADAQSAQLSREDVEQICAVCCSFWGVSQSTAADNTGSEPVEDRLSTCAGEIFDLLLESKQLAICGHGYSLEMAALLLVYGQKCISKNKLEAADWSICRSRQLQSLEHDMPGASNKNGGSVSMELEADTLLVSLQLAMENKQQVTFIFYVQNQLQMMPMLAVIQAIPWGH
eukprot:362861-Chlamydomonas_euryale.AAC.4